MSPQLGVGVARSIDVSRIPSARCRCRDVGSAVVEEQDRLRLESEGRAVFVEDGRRWFAEFHKKRRHLHLNGSDSRVAAATDETPVRFVDVRQAAGAYAVGVELGHKSENPWKFGDMDSCVEQDRLVHRTARELGQALHIVVNRYLSAIKQA